MASRSHKPPFSLSKKWQRLPALLQAVIILAGCFLVLGGMFIGFLSYSQATEQDTAAISEVEHLEMLREDDATLENILTRTIEKLGGTVGLETVTSLRKSGTLVQGEQTFVVEYYYKNPRSLRFRLSQENIAVTIAFNGEFAWQQQELRGVAQPWTELDKIETAIMRRNAEMVLPITHFFDQMHHLRKREDAMVNEHLCYVIEYVGPLESRQVFFIDKVEFLIRKRERIDRFDETPERLLEVFYEDYRLVEGRQFAFVEDVYVDGEPDNRFTIEETFVNPGVLSTYFSPPPQPQPVAVP